MAVVCVCVCAQDSCTVLHAAVRSGHVDTLRLLLCHPLPGEAPAMTFDPCILALPADLLNQANTVGWTAAHMAAASGLKVRTEACTLARPLMNVVLYQLSKTSSSKNI